MSNGGIIGPPNVPTQELASGVWTLGEQYLARVADIWPLPVPDVPAVVTNSVMWLDAADLSTITESGGSVSQWDNKGSLGNFTQGTGANQPTTGASTLNGLNVINFAADHMISADSAATWKFLHDGTKHLVSVVWKPGTTADPNKVIYLFTTAFTGSEVGMLMRWDDRAASSRNNSFQHDIYNSIGNDPVVQMTDQNTNFMPPNAFNVTTVIVDPSNAPSADRSIIHLDAGSALKFNSRSGTPSSSNPQSTLLLGVEVGGARALEGSIAEIVIVTGADATEGNRVIIRDYLNAKWGVYA